MDYILPASPNWYCCRIVDCDSRGIACIGCKNAIYAWNVSLQPPKFISYITAHQERVVGVSLCPTDGGGLGPVWCCSAGEDGKVRIWDFDNKSLLKEHEQHRSKPTCVHWSPVDRNLIASSDEKGTVVLWNVSSGETWNWQPDFSNAHIFCIAFSPKVASLLAVGFKSGNIVIVNVSKKNPHVVQRLRGHEDEIQSIAWRHCADDAGGSEDKSLSKKETLVATSSRDKTIRIWNTQTGQAAMTFTVPSGFGNSRREEMGAKARVWVALAWPPGSPTELISTGLNGELMLWNTSQAGKAQILNPGSSHKGHNRIVFSIATGCLDFKTLISVSMDRQIIIWDLQKPSIRMVIPTLGGFVFAIDRSEIQPDRLAIGVGDNVLRVCHIDKASSSIDVQTFWQGIKAKVTAVSWHPVTEGKLAFGTEDGKVGIYDVHTTRPPLISSTYHKKVVFDVHWGRACGAVTMETSLYSVGDGIIYQHRPSRLDQQAEDINVIIRRTNKYLPHQCSAHSCMAFGVGSRYLAVGNEDGSIDIFETPDLRHVCKIQVLKKLLSCLKWHPVMDKDNPSPFSYWLAASSRDPTIHVFNLQKILDRYLDDDKIPEVVSVTESFCRLEGHMSQVTRVDWSPHEDGLLASASFDWTVQVWDVKQGCPIKNYRGHNGHVHCLLWDETDPDVIFSGSDDYTLHGWRISNQTHIAPPTGHEKRRKKARPKNTVNEALVGDLSSKAEVSSSTSSLNSCVEDSKPLVEEAGLVANKTSVTTDDVDRNEWLRLLEQKRLEILAFSQTSASGIKDDDNNDDAGDSDVGGDDNPTHCALSKDSNAKKDRKKRRAKSLFPKSSAADNRGKQPTQQDCIDFARFKYSGNLTNLDLDHSHLGCFVDRRNTYALFQQEELYHLEHENYEQHMTLNVFKGSVKDAIQVAADSGQLNDHLMAIAPLVSTTCWRDLCVRYAEQLVKEGLFHKATTYYLAVNKVYEAIHMLKEKKLFKDAICLARVRLSPFDPTLRDLYVTWGSLLAKDGNYELAAKCFLAVDNSKEAVVCLARRSELPALRAAALVAVAANETEAARVYAQKFVQESILAFDWAAAAEIVRASSSFVVLALLLSVHEVLVRRLASLNLLTDPGADEEWLNNTSLESNGFHEMPEFLVDMEEKDPLCIWKPLLIGKESFLLHILRIWHKVWNVDLAVSSVTDLYNQLVCLHDAKQNQAGERQMLLEASFNIALGTLKMVLQDFEGSAKFMAAAINIYRDQNQHRIRQVLCRLLFPQGPLYFANPEQRTLASEETSSLDEKYGSMLLMEEESVDPDSRTSISDCSGDKSGGDKSGGDKSGGDKSSGDKSSGDKSSGDKSGGDKSSGDKSSGDKSSGDKSSGDKSSGDKSIGDKSSGDKSSDDKSSGDKSGGDRSSSDKSSGDKSSGDMSSGDKSSGDMSSGDKSSGDKSSGDKISGDMSSGDKSSGDKSSGDKSSGDKSSGDKSSDDKSSGDKSSGDKSSGDKSSGDKSSGDKSSGDKPSDSNTSVLAINTPSSQCSQVDLLTAIYCFTVLEFLVSKQTSTDQTLLSQRTFTDQTLVLSHERGQGDSEANGDLSEAMLDNVDCRYIARLARKLLWDMEVARCRLVESELHIKDAISSLITRHKMLNQGDGYDDPVSDNAADQQVEPHMSPSKIATHAKDASRTCWPFKTHAEDTNRMRSPSRNHQNKGGDFLPMSDGGGKESLALDVVQIPDELDDSALAASKMEESTGKAEGYVVTEENRECSSTCTESSTFDPLCVDASLDSKTIDSKTIDSKTMPDESFVSSSQPFVEIQKIAMPMKDAEFQTDVVSCRYENIPNDWDSYAVDKKYHLPSVTLVVLQKELSRIQSELSRMHCMEHFPHPLVSAQNLLLLATGFLHQQPTQIKDGELPEELCKRICDWGLRSAYTDKWIQVFSEPLEQQND